MDFEHLPPTPQSQEPEQLIKWKAPKPNLVKLEQKFRKLKFDSWDIISFFRTGPTRSYHFDVVKLKARQDGQAHIYEMHPHDCGMKYIILSAEGIDGMKRWEATLGDPIWVMLHVYVKAGFEGYLLKKCPATVAMADDVQDKANKVAERGKLLAKKLKEEENVAVLKL